MTTKSSDEISIKPSHLAALLLAVFGGNVALTTQWTKPEVVRPDPWTGTDARNQEQRLQREIDMMQKRMDAIRENLNLCLAQMHQHRDDGVM